jgi:hypothetical protein
MKMKNTIALIVAFGLLCELGMPYAPPVEKDENHPDQNHRCALVMSPPIPRRYALVLPTHPRSIESFAVTA